MTSRPRLRLHQTSQLAQGAITCQLRDARGAVTPPGKKSRARTRRLLARVLRERFEQALLTHLKALEALEQGDGRAQIAAALLAHAKALVEKHVSSQPRFAQPLSDLLDQSAGPLPPLSDSDGVADFPRAPRDIALAASATSAAEHVLVHLETMGSVSSGATPLSSLSPAGPEHPGILTFREGAGWRLDAETAARLRAFHPEVVLVSPRIPPNTGTVARLCGALCARLHLVEPLGFDVSDKAIRRAGLDYWDEVDVTVHGSLEALRQARPGRRLVLVETGGSVAPSEFVFTPGDLLVFGSETEGLPADLIAQAQETGHAGSEANVRLITIPMYSPRVRSINLANCVSMVLHQAVEQLRRSHLACQS